MLADSDELTSFEHGSREVGDQGLELACTSFAGRMYGEEIDDHGMMSR